jgi:hypothetical protein
MYSIWHIFIGIQDYGNEEEVYACTVVRRVPSEGVGVRGQRRSRRRRYEGCDTLAEEQAERMMHSWARCDKQWSTARGDMSAWIAACGAALDDDENERTRNACNAP